MTRDECGKALRLTDRLIARLSPRSEEQAIAIKLRGMLVPAPTPADVMEMVLPEGTISAKARLLGISRQFYYQLQKGVSRPGRETMQRIADATGMSADMLKGVW